MFHGTYRQQVLAHSSVTTTNAEWLEGHMELCASGSLALPTRGTLYGKVSVPGVS